MVTSPHKHLAIFLVSLLFAITARALDVDQQFRNYNIEKGLPSNCIRGITQDYFGFMWFATDGGLVRFDGIEFRNYPLEIGEEKGIEENFIRTVTAVNNDLWVGTDIALYRYDSDTDTFTPFNIYTRDGKVTRNPVRVITADRDGNLWISVDGKGAFEINTATNNVTQFEFPELNNFVGNIFTDSANRVWIISNQGTGSIFCLDRASNTFRKFVVTVDGKPVITSSYAMSEDASGNRWLGTWDQGVVVFDPYSGIGHYVVTPAEAGKMQHIHSIMPYSSTEMLIGSDCGLTIFDMQAQRSLTYINDELQPSSISDRFVYPIYRDREGGVWIGTFYGGVNYIAPELKKFDRFSFSLYRNSVSGNLISSLYEGADGTVWIVSDDGGLCLYDPLLNRFKRIEVPNNDHSQSHNFHALCMDGDDLWIGSYSHGVTVYNTVNGRCRFYIRNRGADNSIDGLSSYSIFRDRDNTVWVGTENGINRWNRDSNDFYRIKSTGATIIDIDQDASGRLWFCTHGKGLFTYNPATQVWKNYRFSNTSGSILHNHVNCLTIDSRGTIWIGTAKGLCRFIPEQDCFEESDNLPKGINVMSIVEDQDVVWIGTDNGLIRYSPGREYKIYTSRDGLPGNQFMPNVSLKTSNGKIYFGTSSGLTAFFPYQIKQNNYTPSIVFTKVEITNRDDNSANARQQYGNLNTIKHITLHHNDYIFSANFAALSYDSPESNSYIYMLRGFDKDWIESGNSHRVTYTNLPPGTYELKVRGANKDMLWSTQEASLKIKVLPPWYQSLPMKILYILLAIAVTYFIYRYIIHRSNRAHQHEIDKLNASREKEVFQAKLQFFTMIAHEIRTPVSLIIGPLEKIMHTPEAMAPAMKDDLNIIERNSQRLLCLVNQLLDFKKVEQYGMKVTFRHTDINSLVLSVVERFKPSIEQKGGTLLCKMPETTVYADVDPEAVTKLVSNLLNNARKFMRDEITVTLTADSASFTIKVTDNGQGISPENRAKIFKPFYQVNDESRSSNEGTGLGLSIVKSVIEAHGGKIDVLSEVGAYSTFQASFPLHQKETYSPEEPEEKQEELTPAAATKEESSRTNLLIVDDNEEMLNFIATNFNKEYDVILAKDGKDALQQLRKHEVGMIVCDWMMPHMDGMELCRRMRSDKNYSHIPFILLTAKTDNFSKIEGMKGGADMYIEKPFSIEYLKACLHNIFDMRNLLKKKFSESPLEPPTTVASTSVDNEFMTQLTEIIESNFSNNELSVDFLAAKLGISRSSLYSKIKLMTNMTPNELIQLTRLKRAAVLLSEGQYRVSEIGYMVGFGSASYFSKCFKAQFGMKPGEFNQDLPTSPRPLDRSNGSGDS